MLRPTSLYPEILETSRCESQNLYRWLKYFYITYHCSCRTSNLFSEGTVKVNLSLCLEDVWGSEGRAPTFLTSALDGGEWLASRPGCFTPGEKSPGTPATHWIGGCVGPRAGLDAVVKRKWAISAPAGNRTPAVQPVALSLYWLSYPEGSHFKSRPDYCISCLHCFPQSVHANVGTVTSTIPRPRLSSFLLGGSHSYFVQRHIVFTVDTSSLYDVRISQFG
jgi:hypothetical protein